MASASSPSASDVHGNDLEASASSVSPSQDELARWTNVDLAHCQQLSTWDCGLACVKTVVSLCERRRSEVDDTIKRFLDENQADNSIWTIDLAYILRKLDVAHTYYTVTIGIDPNHAKKAYYKNVIDKDRSRVLRQFEEASECDVKVVNREVDLSEILRHLSTHAPIIVLVDSNFVQCRNHPIHRFTEKWISAICWCFCFPCRRKSFVGHYLVLTGYDLQKKLVFYHNPAFSQGGCKMTFEALEKARTSNGTDQDIIFVQKDI